MTRKDYQQLAEALRHRNPSFRRVTSTPRSQFEEDCNAVADMLAKNSSAFDRELFLRNCGVKS